MLLLALFIFYSLFYFVKIDDGFFFILRSDLYTDTLFCLSVIVRGLWIIVNNVVTGYRS